MVGEGFAFSPGAAEPHVPQSYTVRRRLGARCGQVHPPAFVRTLDSGVNVSSHPILSLVLEVRGDSSRSSKRATPTQRPSGLRKDRLCSNLRPYPTASLVAMATTERAAVGAGGPWDTVGLAPVALLSHGAAHRQHRGQRSNLPAVLPDVPGPSPCGRGLPGARRPPPTLAPTPHSAAPCGPSLCLPVSAVLWALRAADTRGRSLVRATGFRLHRPHPPRDARGVRVPLCPRGQVPGPAAGPPSGRAHCSSDLSAERGAAGGRARRPPAGGAPRRAGSRAISMRKERQRRLSWHSPRALIV